MTNLKSLNFLFILLFCTATVNATEDIWFNKSNQQYYISESGVSSDELFQQFGLHSGLQIKFDKKLSSHIHLLPERLTEDELLRWIEKTFSTIKNTSNNQQLIALTIMPKGVFHSDFLISAISVVEEGTEHSLGNTSPEAKQRYQLRLQQIDSIHRQKIEEQVQKQLDLLKQNQDAWQEKKQRKDQEKNELVKDITPLLSKDPELARRLISIYKSTHPTLEADLLPQETENKEQSDD